ncbi:rhodanese homology domain-containing protein [Collimonas pratensis]|uniref:Rhodanese-like domain protein n=1 Tax=Collimonas pratensis TaxID=279113 RepID=A0A127Q4S6_9BURK|nr:rhodanese homology domain-containing protein [Collimonas pratensis]AMP05049.1 rhodanese-like domain protein [Collimonas pratensis]
MTATHNADTAFATLSFEEIHAALLQRRELALLDVREEAPFAEAHPLFAANLPLGRIELEAYSRIPRRDTRIVVYDDGEGLALAAAQRLRQLGYSAVHLLAGGLQGWRDAGGEIFRDVNAPSKAFGELVESQRHTPSLSAPEVKALLDADADVVVLDARRFDEYHTMSIPGSVSVPGAELVLRVRALAPRPETRVIVNCAGRTRSIIGSQSLINAGIPNPVGALRNGTIGWTLAGQQLEHGKTQRFSERPLDQPGGVAHAQAASAGRQVADRAGVGRADLATLERWQQERSRTTYHLDVRTPEEYSRGHLPGFSSAPGGQLVQETDHVAPVRGARIVLADDDGVRANMTASWLAQMGWEVHVLDGLQPQHFSTSGNPAQQLPPVAPHETVTAQQLARWLQEAPAATVLLDFTSSANYVKQHIPGARFALRSQLAAVLQQNAAAEPAEPVERYVLTCGSSLLAAYAAGDAQQLTDKPVFVLEGGTAAWIAAGLPLESGETTLASPRIDRYRRPYEGTDNPVAAMQAYLDWEYGLVAQLAADGSHGFFVI